MYNDLLKFNVQRKAEKAKSLSLQHVTNLWITI